MLPGSSLSKKGVGAKAHQLFTASVVYVKNFTQSEKRVLVVRGSFLYFLEANTFARKVAIPLESIEELLIVQDSPQLLLLRVKDYHPYLLKMKHRFQLAFFLQDQFHHL